jgi:hypothetical protein
MWLTMVSAAVFGVDHGLGSDKSPECRCASHGQLPERHGQHVSGLGLGSVSHFAEESVHHPGTAMIVRP